MVNLHPSPFLAGAQAVFKAQGREDVHRRRDHLRRLLAALPRLLHLHVPPQGDRAQALHPARLPRLLLAGHGQLHVQPAGLLLDERKVLHFYIFLGVYVLRSCSCILTDSCCEYNYMPGWLVGSAGAGLLHAQFPPLYTLVAGEGGPVTYPTTSRGLLGLVASPPPPSVGWAGGGFEGLFVPFIFCHERGLNPCPCEADVISLKLSPRS